MTGEGHSYQEEDKGGQTRRSHTRNNLTDHESKGLEIWYTNADSLPYKLAELHSRVENSETTPDIILVTEAKPKKLKI